MSALSFFAPRSLPPDLAAKTRSLTCLSLLCFALADVRDGLGPFLGIFLQSHGWTPDSIGYVMTIGGLAGMAVTAPLGALADATRRKRLLLALASLGIVAALALIFLCQHPLLVGGAQIVQAVCAAAMAPTISGLTLGLAGQSHLPAQLGRNEAWNHAGNGLSAMLGGAIGYWYGVPGVFVVMSGMLLLSLYALHGIAPRDIDHAQARGLAPEAEHATPAQRAATASCSGARCWPCPCAAASRASGTARGASSPSRCWTAWARASWAWSRPALPPGCSTAPATSTWAWASS